MSWLSLGSGSLLASAPSVVANSVPAAGGIRSFHQVSCDGTTPLTFNRPWRISFDNLPIGKYEDNDWRTDWRCPEWKMGLNLLEVIDGEKAHSGKSLRIEYPKGVSSCTSETTCVNWKPSLGGDFEQLYYGYRVRFPGDFEFVKGGKLPGVGGGTTNSNGDIPTGYDGWSVRMMWDHDAKLVQYVYHPDQPGKYGDIMDTKVPVMLDEWMTIQTKVVMNTLGKKDGVIKTWINGTVVIDRKDMQFRKTDELTIDRLLFAFFFGGAGPEWAPSSDQHIYFDDMSVSKTPIFFVD